MSKGYENELSALIARAQNGEHLALSDLYGRYARLVLRFLYLRTRDYEMAQDLTQEVFIRVVKNLKGFEFRNEKALVSWLYTIAQRIVADQVRRPPLVTTPLDDSADIVDTTSNDAVRSLTDRISLEQAISLLTKDQQQVLTLRFFGDLSNNEIARALGRSEGSVKALQFRALQALQQILWRDESGPSDSTAGAAGPPDERRREVGGVIADYEQPLARGARPGRLPITGSQRRETGSLPDTG